MTRARAIQTTAAVTANVHATTQTEKLRVAIARLAISTMGRMTAKMRTLANGTAATAAVTPNANALTQTE